MLFRSCDAGRAVRNVGQPVFTPGFEHVKQIQREAQTVGYGRDEDAFEPQTRAQAVYALPEQIEGDEGGGPGIVEVMNQLATKNRHSNVADITDQRHNWKH